MKQIEITQVVNHPYFVQNIEEQMMDIHTARNSQRHEIKGHPHYGELKFKRSPIETLPEKGINSENMPNAYLEVLSGKSTLSARERNFVKSICYKALIETYNKHFAENGTNLQ